MPTINLTANGRDQELILAYLTENASDTLADKINNGVPFEKDGKQLINKKDLDGFMKFACDEARKLAAKDSNSACVEDSVVYGWAIHYFEEDGIQGKLFNPDGTEYKPPAPIKKTTATSKPTSTVAPTPPKPKTQFSFFDMLDDKKDEQKTEIPKQTDDNEPIEQADEPSVEEIADALQKAVDEKHGVKPEQPKKELSLFFVQYMDLKRQHPEDVVLSRLGDFYEAFVGDAVTLSDEFDLTLTGRDVGLESRVPMVGFPYHAADSYIAKIRYKHNVVIIESNGDIAVLNRTAPPICKDDLPDDDIEELSETEMREFDGDIQEPKEMPPYSPTTVDKEIVVYLGELLDGKVDIA